MFTYPDVAEFLEIAKKLRRDKKTAYDHIEDFANLVDTHLDFVKTGLDKQKLAGCQGDRLEYFAILQEEAKSKKQSKQVSYCWWLLFNYQLSMLLTPTDKLFGLYNSGQFRSGISQKDTNLYLQCKNEKRLHLDHETYEKFQQISRYTETAKIDSFPNLIWIPTIEGDLTITDINMISCSGVFLLGMIVEPLFTDGRLMNPNDFFAHDIVHSDNTLFAQKKYGGWEGLHQHYMELPLYPDEKVRQSVEFWYFILTHERISGPGIDVYESLQYILEILERKHDENGICYFTDSKWYKNILPKWIGELANGQDDHEHERVTMKNIEISVTHWASFMCDYEGDFKSGKQVPDCEITVRKCYCEYYERISTLLAIVKKVPKKGDISLVEVSTRPGSPTLFGSSSASPGSSVSEGNTPALASLT